MILKLQIKLESKFSKLNNQIRELNLQIPLMMFTKTGDLDFQNLKNLKEIPIKIIRISIKIKSFKKWRFYKMKVLIKVRMSWPTKLSAIIDKWEILRERNN